MNIDVNSKFYFGMMKVIAVFDLVALGLPLRVVCKLSEELSRELKNIMIKMI